MNSYDLILTFVFIVIFALESLKPYRKDFTHRIRHYRRNAVLAITNGVLTTILNALIIIKIFLWVEQSNIGLLNQLAITGPLSFVISFILFDMWLYFWHKVNHLIPFLWRFHRVHHNDPAMDMSTALRFHPIEIVLSTFINIVIITALGLRIEHVVFYKFFFHANVFFHHSNFAFAEKIDSKIRLFIVTPNMHRVHHSSVQAETDSNFSSVFSTWDRLFGSYRERDTATIEYGLDKYMEGKWQTIKGLLMLPFVNNNSRGESKK